MPAASHETVSRDTPRRRRAPDGAFLREGIVVGLLGAATVAAWFVVLDVVQGRIFFTPAALGSALFLGADSPEAAQVTPGLIAAFTIVHVAAFVALGLVATAIVRGVRRHPPVILGAALLFVTMQTFLIGLIAITATWLVDALTWWSIAVANLLAAVVMGGYLWRRHPELQASLRQEDLEGDQPDLVIERAGPRR